MAAHEPDALDLARVRSGASRLYRLHPAAEMLPMMSDGEIDELAADIREHGLIEPVVFWSDNTAQKESGQLGVRITARAICSTGGRELRRSPGSVGGSTTCAVERKSRGARSEFCPRGSGSAPQPPSSARGLGAISTRGRMCSQSTFAAVT